MQKVHYGGADYILIGLIDESMILMKQLGPSLEEIWRLDFKFMVALDNYIVLSTGIYKLDYERPTLELIF